MERKLLSKRERGIRIRIGGPGSALAIATAAPLGGVLTFS